MRCVFWSLSGHKEPQCCFLPSVPNASEFQACTEGKISCYWALNFLGHSEVSKLKKVF